MAKVYQHDKNGFYVGKTEDYNGPMPHNCTDQKPPETELKKWQRFCMIDGKWQVAWDYRGAQGWLYGEPLTIDTPDLPEGFEFYPPQPTVAERIAATKQERAATERILATDIVVAEKLAELTGDKAPAKEAKAEFDAMAEVYDEMLGLLEGME